MFKRIGPYFLASLVGLVFIVSLTWIIVDYYLPAPPSKIIVTTGTKNGAFESIAKQYQAIMADSGINLEIENSEGTGENLARLLDLKSNYQVGFFSEGTPDSVDIKNIMSLGQVSYLPYWIFYRSTKEWGDFDDLKGKRIAIGPDSTGRHKFAKALHLDINTPKADLVLSGSEAIKAMREGRVDAIIITGAFSLPQIQGLLLDPSIRLLNFPRAQALTKIFPQLRHLVLPAGIVDFEKNIPPHDVNIIATSVSVLVRKDLHPQIIYYLAQALEKVHSGIGPFHNAGTFPTQYDTGYPMSSEAHDYYKNGPSLINRYLPFWATNYIVRLLTILATILAVVMPLFKQLAKLYDWLIKRYTNSLFQRLRLMHIELQNTLDPEKLKTLERNLNSIDHAVHLLPMRHTDLYFSLISRVDNERKLIEKQLAL